MLKQKKTKSLLLLLKFLIEIAFLFFMFVVGIAVAVAPTVIAPTENVEPVASKTPIMSERLPIIYYLFFK